MGAEQLPQVLTLLAIEDLLDEPHIHVVFLVQIDVVVDREELVDAMLALRDVFDLIDIDAFHHLLENCIFINANQSGRLTIVW